MKGISAARAIYTSILTGLIGALAAALARAQAELSNPEEWLTATLPSPSPQGVLRDNLDEKGGGDQSFEAAAGSGVMIVADLKLCKGFFGAAV